MALENAPEPLAPFAAWSPPAAEPFSPECAPAAAAAALLNKPDQSFGPCGAGREVVTGFTGGVADSDCSSVVVAFCPSSTDAAGGAAIISAVGDRIGMAGIIGTAVRVVLPVDFGLRMVDVVGVGVAAEGSCPTGWTELGVVGEVEGASSDGMSCVEGVSVRVMGSVVLEVSRVEASEVTVESMRFCGSSTSSPIVFLLRRSFELRAGKGTSGLDNQGSCIS